MHPYKIIGEPCDADFVLATMQYGHFDWTKRMLDSIACSTRRMQIVLLDQGSSEADWERTVEYAGSRTGPALVESPGRYGAYGEQSGSRRIRLRFEVLRRDARGTREGG